MNGNNFGLIESVTRNKIYIKKETFAHGVWAGNEGKIFWVNGEYYSIKSINLDENSVLIDITDDKTLYDKHLIGQYIYPYFEYDFMKNYTPVRLGNEYGMAFDAVTTNNVVLPQEIVVYNANNFPPTQLFHLAVWADGSIKDIEYFIDYQDGWHFTDHTGTDHGPYETEDDVLAHIDALYNL